MPTACSSCHPDPPATASTTPSRIHTSIQEPVAVINPPIDLGRGPPGPDQDQRENRPAADAVNAADTAHHSRYPNLHRRRITAAYCLPSGLETRPGRRILPALVAGRRRRPALGAHRKKHAQRHDPDREPPAVVGDGPGRGDRLVTERVPQPSEHGGPQHSADQLMRQSP